jgi:hypothetical protein
MVAGGSCAPYGVDSPGPGEGEKGYCSTVECGRCGAPSGADRQARNACVQLPREVAAPSEHEGLALGAAEVGIENFRWHDLRHTWASWHVQAGTPLHVLQELGGWECVEMVRKYAHLSTEHLADYVDRLSSLRLAAQDGVATFRLRAQK